jgi:hypothetical protein
MLPYLAASCSETGFPASSLSFSQGLAEKLPLPDESQDVVISTLVRHAAAGSALYAAGSRRVDVHALQKCSGALQLAGSRRVCRVGVHVS